MAEPALALAHQDGSYYVFPPSMTVEHANRIAIQSAHMSNRTCRVILVSIEEIEPEESSHSPEPNPKRGSPPFPEVEAAGGGSNSPDVSNAHSALQQQSGESK